MFQKDGTLEKVGLAVITENPSFLTKSNNIPIIFYFNGTHADYHQPSDTPDKIEYDLLENRTRLVFYTAWKIANIENRIVVDKATNSE